MKKYNVLFDANLISNYYNKNLGRTGVFFVVYNVLKELLKREEIKVYLFCNHFTLELVKKFISEYKEFSNAEFFEDNLEDMDLFFSPYWPIDSRIKNSGINCFTIIHDLTPLLFPKFHDKNNILFFKKLINSFTKNDYLFSNSEYTKKDFIKHLNNIDGNKITTTLLATNDNFYQDLDKEKNFKLKEKYNIPQNMRYIFSLCSLEPRKNLIFSVKNFINFIKKNNIDDLCFVLAGSAWDIFIKKLDKEVEDIDKYKDKIIKTGYVDDADLANLYSNAEFTVYTSLYEGFGLPPLEAMKCGCPVIASNTTSLPEVIGDAGIMIDPQNDEELISAYETMYFNQDLRNKLSQKGLEQANKFSWANCVDTMVQKFLSIDYQVPRKIVKFNCDKEFAFLKIKKTFEKFLLTIFNIPIWKIKYREDYQRHYLFGLILMLEIKYSDKNKYKLLGLVPIN